MQTSKRGLALIESFEGFSSTIYDDGTGVMTVGYGTTASDVSPLPNNISRQQAEALLAHHLRVKYEPAVNALGPVNQNQYDALVSFAYNLGPGSMAWDVGRYTRAHNYQAAANAMLAYDHAGGQRLLGLTRRRWAERTLYLTPAATPKPDPYLLFPDSPVKIGHRFVSERGTVKEYDLLKQHPYRNYRKWKALQPDLAFFRDRLYAIAVVFHGGWGKNGRGIRYQALARRVPHGVKPATR